jgi:CRP-like cAMP-binding protein
VGALRAVPPFAETRSDHLELIDSLTYELHVPSNRVLAREGEFVQQFMIVTDGYAAVCTGDTPIGTLGPGSTFGGAALLEHECSRVTVVTVAPTSVRVASSREFRSLLHAVPEFAAMAATGFETVHDVPLVAVSVAHAGV